ncbi:hypothetical protein SDJN03_20899, partial [Cucurbita argyrosperma subsp. sororia]
MRLKCKVTKASHCAKNSVLRISLKMQAYPYYPGPAAVSELAMGTGVFLPPHSPLARTKDSSQQKLDSVTNSVRLAQTVGSMRFRGHVEMELSGRLTTDLDSIGMMAGQNLRWIQLADANLIQVIRNLFRTVCGEKASDNDEMFRKAGELAC